jgi:hypothetical protein
MAYLHVSPGFDVVPSADTVPEQTATTTALYAHVTFADTFTFAPLNMTMSVADGWKPVTITANQLPGQFKRMQDIKFAFQKEGTACVLVYGAISHNNTSEYEQSSFATRVFTKRDEQLDSSWWIDESNKPENFTFLWEGEQPMPHEVRVIWYPWSQAFTDRENTPFFRFILFDASGAAVDRGCDADLNAMLSSIDRDFRPLVGPVDKGIFYVWRSEWGDRGERQYMFRPDGSEEAMVIAKAAYPYDFLGPVFYKQRFYAVNADSVLTVTNPFTGATEMVSGIPYGDRGMASFTFIDNILYYTLNERNEGGTCGSYVAKCDSVLYMQDIFSGGDAVQLASGVQSEAFLGKDPVSGKIYLDDFWGDAGCVSHALESYDPVTKTLVREITMDVSGCYDEDDAVLNAFTDFTNRLKPTFETASYLRVQDGAATPVMTTHSIESPDEFQYIVE